MSDLSTLVQHRGGRWGVVLQQHPHYYVVQVFPKKAGPPWIEKSWFRASIVARVRLGHYSAEALSRVRRWRPA